MDGKDALLGFLVEINEEASVKLMTTQIDSIMSKLKTMKVKVDLDSKSLEKAKSQLREVAETIKTKQTFKGNSGLLDNLDSSDVGIVKEQLATFEKLGGVLKEVYTDGDKRIKGFTTSVRDLNGAVKNIRFGEGGEISGAKIITNTEKIVQNLKKEAASLDTQLAKLTQTMAREGATPQTQQQEVALIEKREQAYARLTATIQKSEYVRGEYKNNLVAEVATQLQAAEASIKLARDKGIEEAAIKKANASVSEYRRNLEILKNIKIGKTTGFEQSEIEENLNSLRETIGVTDALKDKIAELDERHAKGLKAAQINIAKKEYENLGKTVEDTGKKLVRAQINLDKATLKGNTQDIVKYKAEINTLETALQEAGTKAIQLEENLKIDPSASLKNAIQEHVDLKNSVQAAADVTGKLDERFGKLVTTLANGDPIGKLGMKAEGTEKELDELGKALLGNSAILRKSSKDHSNFNQMTEVLTYSVKDADGQFKLYTYTLDKATNQLRLTGVAVDTAKQKVAGFSNQILDAAKKIATWGLSTKLVYGTWRAFQEGIEVVKELDKELTQIAIVQGMTRDSTKYLGEQFADTAVKMAQTTQDVAKLNTELIRQGLNLEDSAARANTIMKLSSAGMVSMEQSLQVITTGVNALGETHEKVADVILKASMLSASDVEGLGEAFSKTASGAKAAGLSIEETSALLATMKEITQEGDSQLGTSLKSMLARFSKINEETGDLNEDLNQVQTAIESVGVEFVDSEGQIRSFYDIVEDLSVGWKDLDKNTKSYIATQAAGVRQQNRFFAVMDNFNKVQAINNDLMYSAGTLNASYTTYMESSEAAAKRFEAATQRMWANFLDSDVITFGYEVAESMVKIIEKAGVLESALFAIFTGIMLKNIEKTRLLISGIAPAIQKATAAVKAFHVQYQAIKASQAITPIIQGAEQAGPALLTMGGLFKKMGASAALAGKAVASAFAPLLIAGIAAGAIGLIVKEIGRVKAEAEEARSALIDMAAATQNRLNSKFLDQFEIEDMVTKIDEYRSRLNTLTTSELKDYYELNQALIEKVPELETQTDHLGQQIVKYGTTLDEVNKKFDELVQKDFTNFKNNIEEIFEIRRELVFEETGIDEINKKLVHLQQLLDGTTSDRVTQYGGSMNVDDLDVQGQIDRLITENGPELQLVGQEMMSLITMGIRAESGEISNIMLAAFTNPELLTKIGVMTAQGMDWNEIANSEEILSIQRAFEKTTITLNGAKIPAAQLRSELDILFDQYERGILSIDEYERALSTAAGSTKNLTGDQRIFREEIRNQIAAEQERVAQLRESILTEEELFELRKKNLEDHSSTYQQAGEQVVHYDNLLFGLNGTLEQQNAAYATINEKHPEWAWMMNDKVALSEAIQNAMLAEEQVRYESYANMLLNTDSFLQSSSSGYQQYVSALADYYQGDITNYAELEKSKATFTENLIIKLGGAWAKYFKAVDGSIKFSRDAMERDLRSRAQSGAMSFGDYYAAMAQADAVYGTMTRELNTVNGAFNTLINSIDLAIPPIEKVNTGLNRMNPAGKKAASGVKKAKEEIDELNKAMKATQEATKEVFDFALEYVNWIEEQKREEITETYEKEQELVEDTFDKKIEAIDAEVDRQLNLLDVKEKSIKAEEEALEYMRERGLLQEEIVDLEYQIALASLDSTVGGIARRRTLEEELAEQRTNLDELEHEREKRLQEEAYARERAFIESQAQWKRTQLEITKNIELASLKQVHDEAIRLLDLQYTDEKKYLMAKEAAQTGMIQNLQGQMIPLVAAFKELAIANGEFWTFFGQQQVEDFGNKVTQVMEAIKKLGFETIQVWKEVATAATNASNAAGSASSGSSGGGYKPSPAPAPAPAASSGPSQTSLNKSFQSWLKMTLSQLGYTTMANALATDGSIGPATKNAASTAAKSTRTPSAMDNVLNSIARGNKVTQSMLTTLRGNTLVKGQTQGTTYTASGSRVEMYAQGGKVDYTGPAIVHGTKSKPEYVFNYEQFRDLAKMIAKHELTQPSLGNAAGISKAITVKFDNLIEVHGSVDKESLPEIKRASEDAINKLTTKLKGWGK